MTTVTIDRLGHLGDGIAATAEGPVFAPRTLPGEVVRGSPERDTLHDIKIDTPSDDRVKPPCPVYNTCGGCAVQHASDAFVTDWKVGIVREALRAHAIDPQFRNVHTSPPASRRRAKLSGRRTKSGAIVGFHGRGSHILADASRCHVLSPDLTRVIPALQELVGKVGSRKATVEMTVTATQTGLDLDVTGAPPPEAADLGWFAHWARTSGIVRLSWAGEAVLEEAAPRVTFGEYPVTPPPGAFLQATPDGEAALVSAVQGALGGVGKTVDLFGGCGTFALSVLPDRDVHLVEGDAALTTAALDAWKARSGGPILTTETRDLFRNPLDVDDLRTFEAAIIDPPRAGAAAQTQMLADSAVHQIASVSCNPVTFARDARALIDAGFTLDWVDVVDQFRWSTHVELAASFRRDG